MQHLWTDRAEQDVQSRPVTRCGAPGQLVGAQVVRHEVTPYPSRPSGLAETLIMKDVPTPEKIGRYRILQRIGSGAFATVWLGADDTLDARVAIKVLADNWAHHPDIRARFLQEA